MIWLSILFILSNIYYFFSSERLNISLSERVYNKKYLILLDIFYYITEIFYFIWLILLYFHYTNFAITLTAFLIFNWILNRNSKFDNLSIIIKVTLLLLNFFANY